MPEEVDYRPLRMAGELLPVLLGAERAASLLQSRLQLGVPSDAVAHDLHQLGGFALAHWIFGLIPSLGDVGQDRVFVPVPLGDVGECLNDQIGYLVLPVHGPDIPAGRLQLAPQRLGVLDGAVPGLLGRELGIGEPTAPDQVLQFHLCGDLC